MGKDSERGAYSSPEGSAAWEYITAIISTIGMLTIGLQLGWNAPSIAELRNPNTTIPITTGEISTMASIMSFGHFVSLPIVVLMLDRFGRKNSLLLSAVPLIISWTMIIFAEHATVLIIARMLGGVAMGVMGVTFPIYSAEVYSPKLRGPLGTVGVIAFFAGTLYMIAVGPLLGIRITAAICMGVSIIFGVCFWFVPESPYFLVMVGRFEEAEGALEKLRGRTDVSEEIELIRATLREKGKIVINSDKSEENETDEKREGAFRQLFMIPANRKALYIGITATTVQHLCGMTTILSYCHLIFTDMGIDFDTYLASLIFSILQVISGIICVLNVRKFKRRILLFVSSILTVILLSTIATYFFLKEHTNVDVKSYNQIPLYATFLLVIALNIGVVTLPGMILSEIFGPEVKVLANCIVGLCGSFQSILSTKSYLLMATSWGFGHSIPFYFYALITTVCAIIFARWLPETKDKTLLEIQRELTA